MGPSYNRSHYEIINQGYFFENGNKIDDTFPQQIHIFSGNSQVSEQMIFELNGKSQLLYRYNLLNFDGFMESRSVKLSTQAN